MLGVDVLTGEGPLWLLDGDPGRLLLTPAEGCSVGEALEQELPGRGTQLEAVSAI